MCKSPFGPYHGDYDDPYYGSYDGTDDPNYGDYDDTDGYGDNEKSSKDRLGDKLSEADELFEQLSDMEEDEGEDWRFPEGPDSPAPSDSSAQTGQAPPLEKTTSVQARFLSDLTDRVVADGKLLLTEDGRTFGYQEGGGYYKPINNLEAFLANVLPPNVTRNLLSRNLREIAERLGWEKAIRCDLDDYNHDPHVVNLENGVFNIASSELIEHDPSFRFTYQIHARYLEGEVSCPEFERFCQTSLDGDPAKRQLLLEFIGYSCTDTNEGKCALVLKGQPNSGKSVISSFIIRLPGKKLVSNIPLHQLGDRFFRAELAGKKLNVAGEIAGRALRDISIFKSITGNDRLVGEFKGRDPFYFTPRCKMLFSGNTLPLTTEVDATAAFVNRIRVLLFNSSTPPEKQDKHLLDKLWEERDAIVTLALDAVRKLIERGFEFTLPEDSKQFLDSLTMRGNVIQVFIDECCVLGPNERVFNVELYAAFEAFCKRNGLERLSRTKFYALLSGIPHVIGKRIRIENENRQGHVGIALKKEALNGGTLEQQP